MPSNLSGSADCVLLTYDTGNLLEFGGSHVKGKLQNVITPLDCTESKIRLEIQSCM